MAEPEQQQEQEQQAPTGVEVEIEGQKFLVTEEFKEALERQNRAMRTTLEEQMRLEQSNQQSRTEPAQETPPEDLSYIDDPKKLADTITQRVTENLRAEQLQKETEQEFWNRFYKKNPDLKERASFVEHMGGRIQAQLEQAQREGGEPKVMTMLADAVREQIQVVPPKGETPTPGVILEGGPQQSIEMGSAGEPEEKVPTMSDLIRKRRAAKVHRITQTK